MTLNSASMAMDATGFGAAFSWIPDVADGFVSLVEGDYLGAGLSAAATIPMVGNIANGIKLGGVGADATRLAEEATEGSSYVCRGVHEGHPAMTDALAGRAVPGDVNGTITAAQHNAGGVSANSPFT